MTQQNNLVALGLSAAILGGLYFIREQTLKKGASPTPFPPGPTPPGPPTPGPTTDPNVEAARTLIRQFEAQVAAGATPAQRQAMADQLVLAANGIQATSPQAAAELRDAAVRIRGGVAPGPSPGPAPGPTVDPNLEAARVIIRQYEQQIQAGATEAQRRAMADQLELSANAIQLTSPQAAAELREAASRIRPATGTGQVTAPLVDRYDGLRGQAVRYLQDVTGQEPMDATSLGAMDRTTRDLYTVGDQARSNELGALATACYAKKQIPRPTAVQL